MNAPESVATCLIYATASSRDEALAIARALVDEKLVACVNILGEATSIYRWQGAVEETRETVLIAKTRKTLARTALERIEALHSYDVPCAVVYDAAGGLSAYLSWIAAETDTAVT